MHRFLFQKQNVQPSILKLYSMLFHVVKSIYNGINVKASGNVFLSVSEHITCKDIVLYPIP